MTIDAKGKINQEKFLKNISDPEQSAKAVNLVYVNHSRPGYSRSKQGRRFIYWDGKKRVKNKHELERIKRLVIPPAWKEVWICKLHNGHLQATGIDKLGRKQYMYHSDWNQFRNQTKFYRLAEFGKKLPQMRLAIKKKLSLPGYPKEKVLAALMSILQSTNIRIGNSFYEKLHGSFGLTTLKNRHVNIKGVDIKFSFIGKKGVRHNITLHSTKLARIIKGCKEIPGKELFEYIDDNGIVHDIDSGTVNEFIKMISGGDFTTKDFRTWAGSVQAIIAFKELGNYETETELRHKLSEMFDFVAKQLGNTKAVCKKYYIHPVITELYEKNKMDKYICNLRITNGNEIKSKLSPEEKVLMKILKRKKF